LGADKNYKDSLFRALFGDAPAALGLYGAVSGRDPGPGAAAQMKALDGAMLGARRNDVAFVVDGSLIVLVEHQSTPNPNMPLRMWQYALLLYQSFLDLGRALYGERLVSLPRPEFYVLYNGRQPRPPRYELRLSDAFAAVPWAGGPPRLELAVEVVDIGLGANPDVLARSAELLGYSALVDRARRGTDAGMERGAAVREAVDWCLAEGLLAGFLKKHRSARGGAGGRN